MSTTDFCEKFEPENWQEQSEAERKAALSGLVNDAILKPRGYKEVPLESEDPNNLKCGGDPACFHDDDNKIYFNEEVLKKLPPSKGMELLTHEALHAMDNQDFGSSKTSEMLGDKVADHHTFRWDWPPGSANEYGETRYEQGDIIPGAEHVNEVYLPAEEITSIIQEECEKARALGKPLTLESLKRRIGERIRKILKERWKPKPKS